MDFRHMNKFVAVTLLLITTFFWGITFTVVKEAVSRVDVYVFLAQRFTLAFVLLFGYSLARRPLPSGRAVRDGIVLGVFLFAAFAFQTVALLSTSASNTGFLTGLNVVFVPIIAALAFRQPIPFNVKLAVTFAVTGLYLLCTNGTWSSFNQGDLLAAICAVCVALHLLLTSHFARRSDSDIYWLTTLQIGTVAALSIVTATATHHSVIDFHRDILPALLICSLFATVFAFLVQTSMQRYISPTHTALIFCTEPVFAAIYAHVAAGERLGSVGYMGSVLIITGMILSEIIPNGNPEPVPTREQSSSAASGALSDPDIP
jgi:drug/metabolite transporter (DMT)-like permease